MMPIIFINCKGQPFVDQILAGTKEYETRTRNMLGRLNGERVLIAETGHGRPLVKCSAYIDHYVELHSREQWEHVPPNRHSYRCLSHIDSGSPYDWQPDTKVKYLYHLTDVHPVEPFRAPEGRRHGRVWMEYEGSEPCVNP